MLISKFNCKELNAQKEIESFENRYNIKLPDQYRQFLKKYNGGYTPETEFRIRRICSDIKFFYGLGNVNKRLDSLFWFDEWLKRKLLPIAEDIFDNSIAIGLDRLHYGKIYFCDHERGYKKTLLTDDLKSFLMNCNSKEIDELYTRSVEEREAEVIADGNAEILNDNLRRMWQEQIDFYKNMVQEEVVLD